MLDNFILLFFDIGLLTLYSLIGFVGFLLIQLISYRILHFNLYKWLMTKLEMN